MLGSTKSESSRFNVPSGMTINQIVMKRVAYSKTANEFINDEWRQTINDELQKSKVKIIFSNIYTNLHAVIRIYWFWWRHHRFGDVTTSKYLFLQNLTKNSFNKQKFYFCHLPNSF